MLPRAAVLLFALTLVLPGRALAADVVTLHAEPSPVSYGSKVALSGTLVPATADESVVIYARKSNGLSRVVSTTTDGLGALSVSLPVSRRAVYVARALDETGAVIESAPVPIHVLPRIAVKLRGSKTFGARLYLAGRMLPHTAGVLTVDSGDRVSRVSVDAAGRFAAPLTTTRSFRYRATLRLHPASGYVGWHASRLVDVQLPGLAFGAHGPAVFWLQESLRHDGYALPSLSSLYDSATVDAVLAFEKVQGLPLTGSVNRRLWSRLGVAGPPRARIPYGDHIEVSKTTQLLYEVRAGKVVSVTRVSTGATGNTPVGHFYVYTKGPGFNQKGMYDSLYFLRGFAIHGYASVPTYPASHGCVRTPLWFAPGFYSRWDVGASVYVFA